MDKLELRARARATAFDSGLFEFGGDGLSQGPEPRGRTVARARPLAPPVDPIDEAQASAACKPMGELEYVIRSVDAQGRSRVLYVIVPDLALRPHYERLGLEIDTGCRVLVDSTEMRAVAVLRVSARKGQNTPPLADAAAGFNPYFDMPPA